MPKNNYTITLRPATYRRLKALAALLKEDPSETGDFLLAYQFEQQQRIANPEQYAVCSKCEDESCPGTCYNIVPITSAMKPLEI